MNITWQWKDRTCDLKIDPSAIYLVLEKSNSISEKQNKKGEKIAAWNHTADRVISFPNCIEFVYDQRLSFMFVN